MGFGGIGPGSIILILIIIILLFGTKKLRNAGTDLGGAIRNFKKSMKEGGEDSPTEQLEKHDDKTIEGEVVSKTEEPADKDKA